jgi:hypothetical protein
VSMSKFMAEVLREAALQVARKFAPRSVSREVESRIGRLASERPSTAVERRLYALIVRQPALRAAFKEPSRTDFVPRLRTADRERITSGWNA